MADIVLDKFQQAAFREANEGLNSALADLAEIDAKVAALTAARDAVVARVDAFTADLADFVAHVGGDVKTHLVERQPDNSYLVVDHVERAKAEATLEAALR